MSTRLTDFSIVSQVDSLPENTLVIVGAALDGPSNIPFKLADGLDPYDYLGQSPLADAYYAAQQMSMNNIIAYRLNGVHATAMLVDRDGKQILELESVSASDNYNLLRAVVYPDHLYVVGTDEVARSYFFNRYKTARELAYAINRDAFYGLLEFNARIIDEYYILEDMVDIETDLMFQGGLTEAEYINHRDPLGEQVTIDAQVVPMLKERLKTALFGIDPDAQRERDPGGELGVLPFGVITVCDLFHDDDVEVTEMLGSFCKNKTEGMGVGCMGVVGTKPIFPTVVDEGDEVDFDEDVQMRILELTSLTDFMADEESLSYVQVIVGQTEYVESDTSSISLAYAYAAAQAQYSYNTIMSNKRLEGVGNLKFDLSKEDVALLTANGYICIVPSIRRGFVPYYSTSYSKNQDSVLSKPHHIRISQYVSRILTEELDMMVGENYTTLSIKDAISAAETLLNDLVVEGIFREYSLEYSLSNNNTEMSLEVSLTPFSEIRAIASVATVSFPQGVIV